MQLISFLLLLFSVVSSYIILYIIIVGQKLPHTCSPEYLAAQRAYMRYHNMNPIWGISSKQQRAADDH